MPEDTIRQRLAELSRGRDHEFLSSQIFADQLNYPVALAPLPRQKWNPDVARTVCDAHVLNAAGDFKIIYCQTEQLRRGIQRPIMHELLKYNVPSQYFLTVFSDRAGTAWDFISPKVQPSKTAPLLRFLPVRNDGRHRTAAEILLRTEFKRGMSPIQLQSLFDLAFDKELVTDAFFEDFRLTFAALAKEIEDHNNGVDAAQAETLAQELLDRLLFLYFIQRKGWLNGDRDYLPNRYAAFRNDAKATTFYHKFLFRLFQKLSIAPDREFTAADLGVIPFLNGGLFDFDPLAGDTEVTIWTRLKIRNRFFEEIFDAHDGLFEKYNFTVREDTPLDTTVAVDPEMLGRIFESLVLKMEKGEDLRKKTGSFYTPRVIVHSMCQESLLHYLLGKLGGNRADWQRKLETLLAISAADGIDAEEEKLLNHTISVEEAKALRKLVLACRVCDPAVGSGAFPIGMLHEMVNFVRLCDARIHGPKVLDKRNYDYKLKRQIIEECLYGVDIQEKAVRICEIRLWLSLVVEYDLGIETETASPQELDIAVKDIPALPNLTYHVRCGDSLVEKLFGHPVRLANISGDDDKLVAKILDDKQRHYSERDINQKRRIELAILRHYCELAERLIERRKQGFRGIQKGMFGESKAELVNRERAESELSEYNRIEKHAKLITQRIDSSLEKKRLPEREYEQLREQFQGSIVWRLDFAQVFTEKGGFDVTLGNPPYKFLSGKGSPVKQLERAGKPKEAQRLQTYYDDCARRYAEASIGCRDYYKWFAQMGTQITREDGVFCFITPNTWVTLPKYHDMRVILATRSRLEFLLDLGFGIFKDPIVPSAVFLTLPKTKPREDFQYLDFKGVERKDLSTGAFQELWTELERPIPIRNGDFAIYGSPIAERFFGNPDLPRLGQYVRIWEGEHSLQIDKSQLVSSKRDGYLPILLDDRLKRWCSPPVRYLPEDCLSTYSETVHAGARLLLRKTGDKIVSSAVSTQNLAIAHQNVYVVKLKDADGPVSLHCIQALLASQFLSFLYQNGPHGQKGRTLAQFRVCALNCLPLPDEQQLARRSAEMDRLAHAVEESPPEDRESCEAVKRIEQIVTELYGLSPSEARDIVTT